MKKKVVSVILILTLAVEMVGCGVTLPFDLPIIGDLMGANEDVETNGDRDDFDTGKIDGEIADESEDDGILGNIVQSYYPEDIANIPLIGVPIVPAFNKEALEIDDFTDYVVSSQWGLGYDYMENFTNAYHDYMLNNWNQESAVGNAEFGYLVYSLANTGGVLFWGPNPPLSGEFEIRKKNADESVPINYYELYYAGNAFLEYRERHEYLLEHPEDFNIQEDHYIVIYRAEIRNDLALVVPNPVELEAWIYDYAFDTDDGDEVWGKEHNYSADRSWEENLAHAKDFGDYYVMFADRPVEYSSRPEWNSSYFYLISKE